MKLSAVVRSLVTAGATPEMILAAVEAFEASSEDALAKRRASDAARQKARRVRQTHVTSRDVTVTVRDNEMSRDKDARDARVRTRDGDINSNSEIDTPPSSASSSASVPADDWPKGSAKQWIAELVQAAESPWLDPCKSPGLVTTASLILAWKRAGASWEHDVLPVVTSKAQRAKRPITGWSYFDPIIAESIAANRRALEIPAAGEVIRLHATGPPRSYDERSAAVWDEVERRIAEGE